MSIVFADLPPSFNFAPVRDGELYRCERDLLVCLAG